MSAATWTTLDTLFGLMLVGGMLSTVLAALCSRVTRSLFGAGRGSGSMVAVLSTLLVASIGGFGILARQVLALGPSASVFVAAIGTAFTVLPWLRSAV